MPVESQDVLHYVATLVLMVAGWAIKHFVANASAQKAAELLAYAAASGVRAAWATYTEKRKAASADGTLTEAESQAARKAAFDAAVASLGGKGFAVVKGGFSEGWEAALNHALEAEYATWRAANRAPEGTPSTPR